MWMAEERWDTQMLFARAAWTEVKELPENPFRQARPATDDKAAAVDKKRFWDRMFHGLFGTTDPFKAAKPEGTHGDEKR